MKGGNYASLLEMGDHVRYGATDDEVFSVQKGCFSRVTSALSSFFRSPFVVYAAIVGTSVAASAAAVTIFSEELEHLEEGAHKAGIHFPVHSNSISYSILAAEMATAGTYLMYKKLKNTVPCVPYNVKLQI